MRKVDAERDKSGVEREGGRERREGEETEEQ